MNTITSFKIILAFIIIGFGLDGFTQEVSRNQATQVGKNFFLAVTKNQKTSGEILSLNPVTDGSQIIYYVINFNPEGWVIVAADQGVDPIIAYNATGFFDHVNANPGAQGILDFHKEYIRAVRALPKSRTNINENWFRYSDNQQAESQIAIKTVGPLMYSTWDQGQYYNAHCPDLACYSNGPDGKAYVGCVATAMGQVMNYFRGPVSPKGYHSYYDPQRKPCGTGSTRKIDFGTMSYDWSKIKDNLNGPNNDVARLLFNCGMSINMDYEGADDGGSGADPSRIPNSLKNYFRFPSGGTYLKKSNYTNTKWEDLIIGEINNSRPVIYGGYRSTTENNKVGHSFVIDGYVRDESTQKDGSVNMFHINYGWGGAQDGNYRVTGGLKNTVYSLNMDMVVNITGSKPTQPLNITASDTYDDKITISWHDDQMGYYYLVLRGTTPDPSKMTAISGWTKSLSYNDYTALPGVTYYYSVRSATTKGGTWSSNNGVADSGIMICKCSNVNNDICEGFESYTLLQKIGPSSPCWTTWSGNEGGTEDATIDQFISFSNPTNNKFLSFNPTSSNGLQDVVLQLGNRTSGNYELKFNIRVPSNSAAYFNILHNFVPGTNNNTWAFETNFGTSVTGSLRTGNTKIGFVYPKNVWFPVVIRIDLNNQKASLTIDNKLVYSWIFSWTTTQKTIVSRQLAALNFYTINTGYRFYIDDLSLTKLNDADNTNLEGRSGFTVEDLDNDEIISQQAVITNYPNPFSDNTTIQFNLPEAGEIGLRITDLSGRILSTLVDEHSYVEAGLKNYSFDGSMLPTGIYLALLTTNSGIKVHKLYLQK